MSKADKKLSRMRNNPRGDWVLDDLITLASRHGITFKNQVGSHATFTHQAVSEILTVPAARPIKPHYIKRFVAMIDEIDTSVEDEEN